LSQVYGSTEGARVTRYCKFGRRSFWLTVMRTQVKIKKCEHYYWYLLAGWLLVVVEVFSIRLY
jgi:hypothetical protein